MPDINTQRETLSERLLVQGVDPKDWSEDYSLRQVNEALEEYGGTITLDVAGMEGSQCIIACYYSDVIRRTIIIDWDVFRSYDRIEDLADYLLRLQEEAVAIEAGISGKK